MQELVMRSIEELKEWLNTVPEEILVHIEMEEEGTDDGDGK